MSTLVLFLTLCIIVVIVVSILLLSKSPCIYLFCSERNNKGNQDTLLYVVPISVSIIKR